MVEGEGHAAGEGASHDVGEGEGHAAGEGTGVGARVRLLAGVAALVTVVVVLVAALGSGGGAAQRSARAGTAVARTIDTLLAGIPQHGNVLGRAHAPVTLRWYGDLECPYCREFALGAFPSLVSRWVRAGALKVEYEAMETATRQPKVFQDQEVAALSAGLQGRMWNFVETFYGEQGQEDSGYVTEKYLRGIAGQVPGLNVSLWGEDRFDPQLAARVASEKGAAEHAGFTGTPTFLIGRSDTPLRRLRYRSLVEPRFYDEVIELLLRGRRGTPATSYV